MEEKVQIANKGLSISRIMQLIMHIQHIILQEIIIIIYDFYDHVAGN